LTRIGYRSRLFKGDRTREEWLAKDERCNSCVAQPPNAIKVAHPTCNRELHRWLSAHQLRKRTSLTWATTVAKDDAHDPCSSKVINDLFRFFWRRLLPWECREPIRPRVKSHGEPVASGGKACTQQRWVIDHLHADNRTRRTGGEDELDRLGRFEPTCDLEWCGDKPGDRSNCGEVCRSTGTGAIKVNEMNQLRTLIHEHARNSRRLVGWCTDAGCSTWPKDEARPASFKVDRRNDEHGVRLGRCVQRSSSSSNSGSDFGCCDAIVRNGAYLSVRIGNHEHATLLEFTQESRATV
jgi:hypothetical protein